jgi:hypothetical protein
MSDTPNHQYNTPAKGTTDWDVPINQNFDNLDTDVEIRDTEANKGNYTPKSNALYRATDSGAVYLGNGSSWVLADAEFATLAINSQRLYMQDTAPSGTDGDVWIDTS